MPPSLVRQFGNADVIEEGKSEEGKIEEGKSEEGKKEEDSGERPQPMEVEQALDQQYAEVALVPIHQVGVVSRAALVAWFDAAAVSVS